MNRIQNYSSGAVRMFAAPGESLCLDDIRQAAPAIFAEAPHGSRSERFAHIPTHQMLGALMREGFLITAVSVGGSRDVTKLGFTKHMIRMRRNDTSVEARNVGDVFPEVILKNGHDGTSQYHLMMGLFRLVCLNGLVVSESSLGDVKVPHRGRALDKVIEGSYEVISHSSDVLASVDAMRSVTLDEGEARAFAKAALVARYGDAEDVPEFFREHPLSIMRARRREDTLPDLWTSYNRAQENLIKGGLHYRVAGVDDNGVRRVRDMTTKEVRSVDGDIRLNRALWALAEEMRKLKS